jgi:NTE family protein
MTSIDKKRINLALQGGGAHDAFTRGILDKLLESDLFIIEGISATSAGSMNAVVLAQGMMEGGNDGARLSLYEFNPLNFHHIHEVLTKIIDIEKLRQHSQIKLFICATNVKTGKIRIFKCGDLSINAVLASACLPKLFQAVEVDGEFYWDGGYVGNPAIFPTDKILEHLSMTSVYSFSWDFLVELRDLGREAAEVWLKENFIDIGNASTIDLKNWL